MEKKQKKIKPILERMKYIAKARNYTHLLEMVGWKKTTYENWVRNDEIPDARLYEFSVKYGIDVDYLTGKKDDPDLFPRHVYDTLNEAKMVEDITRRFKSIDGRKKGHIYEIIIGLLKTQ